MNVATLDKWVSLVFLVVIGGFIIAALLSLLAIPDDDSLPTHVHRSLTEE